jgi:hypothetical protein
MNNTPDTEKTSTRTPDKFHVVEINGPVEPQQKWNVATVDHTPFTQEECDRFLACYKACEGMDDPEEVISQMRELVHSIDIISAFVGMLRSDD